VRIAVIGAGLMGSQIGCEYALAGHEVTFVARRPEAAGERVAAAFAVAERFELAAPEAIEEARGRVGVAVGVAAVPAPVDVVAESVVEDLAAKGEVLAEAARAWPDAILATNTSSLSIGAIGEGAGAPARTVGVHYWNPPLLMPLVEVIRGDRTDPGVVERMTATLRAMGKRPVLAQRDVPGFIWNRLQLALLREAVWIVENGVATPEAVDQVVREGLARRWRYTGPFQTAALGGAETFARVAANLFPVLSTARRLEGLPRWLDADAGRLAAVKDARDVGLAEDLKRERALTDRGGPTT
jgi:3-hydroxybutyryl-CoA dehydrogenase